MPTYQYACTACDERLEAVQSFTDAPLTQCPACGGRLRKVFSAVGVVFKGSGFYKTDSRGGAKSNGSSDSGAGEGSGDKAASGAPSSTGGSSSSDAASSTPSGASSAGSSSPAPSSSGSKAPAPAASKTA